jgi:hypothetical protein
LLHPPYTAWHLSYVVIGAVSASRPSVGHLLGAVLAFFFGLGVGGHALDELNGRPLATRIPDRVLVAAAVGSVAVAVVLGGFGVTRVGWPLIPCIVVGCLLVFGYNLEMFGGRLHSDGWFAVAWGGFPVLTGCVAQQGRLTVAAALAAVAAVALSYAQRALSTPARLLRRRTTALHGEWATSDGVVRPVDRALLLRPLETALRTMAWGMVALAAGLAVARLR